MFFSTDLLAQKASPFARIWLLGCVKEKIKAQDQKIDVAKIASAILDWINREDMHRLSLPLSATMVIGYSRLLREQILVLHRDVTRAKASLDHEVRMAQTLHDEPINMNTNMNIDLLVTHVDIENRSQLGNLTDTVPNWNLNQAAPEAITLREFHPTVDDRLVEDEEGFNDFGEGGMVIR